MSHSKKKNYILFSLKSVERYFGASNIIYTDAYKRFGWVPSYCTRKQLVIRLAINTVYTTRKRSIINNLSEDMSETIIGSHTTEVKTFLGTSFYTQYDEVYYLAYRSGEKITHIDYSDIKDEVEECIRKILQKKENARKKCEHRRKLMRYEFRNGPVAHTGYGKCHIGTYYRIPKLKNVTVLNNSCESETKEFDKAKYSYKNLPVWDDRVRHNSKSWKSQYKVKKQWMIHLNNHTDCMSLHDEIETYNDNLGE